MRIAFVLPGPSVRPVGGYKVVYEYANRLADRGHRVSVVHPWSRRPPTSLRQKLTARASIAWMRRRRNSVAPWFHVDSRVDLVLVPSLHSLSLVSADALVATAWQTAAPVADAASGGARGFHLVQGNEAWGRPAELRASWQLPLRKIVISRWLQDVAIEMGQGSNTTLVPNALDFDEFGVDLPPAERSLRVGAIAGRGKGGEDVVAALSIARGEVPKLGAVVFGSGARSPALPEWVDYERLPSQATLRRLYNSCAIFLQASRSEGWGLPAMESMACGCALVTYDNGGSREYAFDGQTALVAARHDPERLASGIVRLARDRKLRLALAVRGRSHVERFTWPRSVSALERVLEGSPRALDDPT